MLSELTRWRNCSRQRNVLADDKLEKAEANQAVTICLDREIDLSRGDLLVTADEPCEVSDQFDVSLVWMDREPGFLEATG